MQDADARARTAREPFVGRDPELASLRARLAETCAGRGGAVLVLGEAGIGKTRLAEALADAARELGCAVAWGRSPGGESPASWPWRQALRTILGEAADELFMAGDGGGRAERFALVVDALARAATGRPTLVILEDLHWADPSTIALVHFVVGSLPELALLLVLTARDEPSESTPEVAALLANLPPAVHRLVLAGLEPEATAAIVRGVVGGEAPEDLLSTVQARTGGNPFFVAEVARLYTLRGGTGAIDVPPGVQQVLARRLARLSQPAAELLALAAVLGRPDVGLLAAVVARPEEVVVGLLVEAVAARLLAPGDPGFAFAHDLVREAVYEEQGPGVRTRLHRRVAEVLATRPGTAAADLATHWTRAGDGATAARCSLDAAREAMADLGYERAVHHYRRALAGGAGDPLVVQTELGEAQVLAGELAAGREGLIHAAGLARRLGRPDAVVRAVLAMGTGVGGFEVDVYDDRQAPLLEWAVAEPSLVERSTRAAALARLSLVLAGRAGQDTRRVALAREAQVLATGSGDARIEIAALAALTDALAGPDHVAARTEAADRMVELARFVDEGPLMLLARRIRLVALLEQGRLAEVDREVDAYARVAERLRVPLYAWPVAMWRGMRALIAGDLGAAERFAEQCAALGARAGSENAELMVFTLRIAVTVLYRPPPTWVAEVRAARERWLDAFPRGYRWCAAAWLAHGGEIDEAAALVRECLEFGFDDLARDSEWVETVWMAGEAGLVLGEPRAMELAYDALRPYAALWVVDGIGAGCYGAVSHQLGRLAAALGRTAEAQEWLGAARADHERAGATLLLARTERALSELRTVGASGAARPPRGTPTGSTGASTGEFRRDGRVWRLVWKGAVATVPDSKGMRDLAALLAVPGRDVAALDLVDAGVPPATARGAHTGPVLDSRARAEYRRRLEDLEGELAEADARADVARSSALGAERDFVARELAGALGLGGRPRLTGEPGERARKAVTMRIGTALRAIEAVHPALGRHLRASISTGRFCRYQPEDDVAWVMSTHGVTSPHRS